jgi:hypothetical protein
MSTKIGALCDSSGNKAKTSKVLDIIQNFWRVLDFNL